MNYGQDGRLISMQLEELIGGLEKEEQLIIQDYMSPGRKKTTVEKIIEELLNLEYEELMKQQRIAKLITMKK